MTKGLIVASNSSLGAAGTTKTQLNGANPVTLPAWVKCVNSIWGSGAGATVVTQAEPQTIKFYLESDDVSLNPYVWSPIAQGSVLSGAAINWRTTPALEEFQVNAMAQGGEDLKVWGQQLTNQTAASYAGATISISNTKSGRQKFAQTGTYTSSGTTASTWVSGTAYTITGAERITEVYGYVVSTTVVAAKPHNGYFKLESSDFKAAVPLKFLVNPFSGALSTSSRPNNFGIIRYDVDVPTELSCTITDAFYTTTASSTAGKFLDGIVYEKVGYL